MADLSEDREILRRLLREQRVLALGLTAEGRPHVGLVPFVATPDLSGALVHVSGLSRHGKALDDGVAFSVLIHEPDRPDADPLQLVRVTLDGTAQVLPRSSAPWEEGRQLFVARFAASAPTFALGDFRLTRLAFSSGRLVAGFARARGISGDLLRSFARP